MLNPQLTVSIPEIFVLWHPRCPLGEKLARRLLHWLRPGNGLGPEVFYRSLPAPDAPPNGLPLPLPGEERLKCDLFTRTRNNVSNLQVVVPLIDENILQHIPAIRTGAKLDLLYPGSGLSSLEIDILGEMYPSLTFKSFEQVLL
jgi:hypothetical protein